jgi:branched-chain amino acid aminotransferase
MPNFLPWVFKQGEFIAFKEATVSVATNSLQYGTAVFGGMRVIPSQEGDAALLFRVDRHAERLARSARYLGYQIGVGAVQERILHFVQKNQISTSAYIRTFIGNTSLGLSPRLHDEEQDFIIYGQELGDYLPPGGVSCRFSSWMRQEDRSFPLRGKISGAYITSSLAKTEAQLTGFDEAILLNTQGKVSEASAMNLFMVRQGVLVTPGVDQDILEGITRESVIALARDMGISVAERPVDKSELIVADEVFLTGSAARITAVKRIESFDLPVENPITRLLIEKLAKVTEGLDPEYDDWITRVPIRRDSDKRL